MDSQTSNVQPYHTLQIIWLLIHDGIKVKQFW